MDRFTHNGITVAYRDVGTGPAIVMLHNGGTSSTIWREQIDHLSDRRRMLAIDLPGFGASPLADPAPTLDVLIDLVIAFIERLDLSPVVLVGNCMGSNIAGGVAARIPDHVAALLLVNPLTEATFSAGKLGVFHKMDRVAAAPTAALRGLVRKVPIPRPAAPWVLRFQLGPKGRWAGLHHDPELVACTTRPEQLPALIDVLDDMGSYGERDAAPLSEGIPTWIVWGAHNNVLSRRKGVHLGDKLRAERTEVLGGCGHLPMLEDPEAVTALISELAGIETEPTSAVAK